MEAPVVSAEGIPANYKIYDHYLSKDGRLGSGASAASMGHAVPTSGLAGAPFGSAGAAPVANLTTSANLNHSLKLQLQRRKPRHALVHFV